MEKGSRSTVEYRKADSSEQSESGTSLLPHDAAASSPTVLTAESIPSLATKDLLSIGQSNGQIISQWNVGSLLFSLLLLTG